MEIGALYNLQLREDLAGQLTYDDGGHAIPRPSVHPSTPLR
jgi:hypothetical protein